MPPPARTSPKKELSVEDKARKWLIKHQQPVTDAGIRERIEVWERRAERARVRNETVVYAITRCGPAAAVFVAEYVGEHGTGPTWNQVRKSMEWPQGTADAIIRGLAREGWLTIGDEHRSLRPGPKHNPPTAPTFSDPRR